MYDRKECESVIAERLATISGRSGQSGTPQLLFEQQRTILGRTIGSPTLYKMWTDTIAVNLLAMYGSEHEGDTVNPRDPVNVSIADGYLGHELGHRRRRWLEWWVKRGWTYAMGCAVIVTLAVAVIAGEAWPGSSRAQLTENIFGFVGIGVMCLSLLWWCVVLLPFARWRERHADVAMVHYAGAAAAQDMLVSLTHFDTVDLGDKWVHETPERRLARVQRLVARGGNVTPVEQTAPHKTEHDDWR